jgi:PDZ domain-containing protein
VVKIGDTITAVDGHHFQSNQGFINYLKDKAVGLKLKLTYQHANRRKTNRLRKIIKLPQTKRNGIGITLTDRTTIKTKIPVKIDAGDIGGPSAGMMFSSTSLRAINAWRSYDTVAILPVPAQLLLNGNVGAIGGIDKKVVAADHAGATLFFAPDDPVTKAIKKIDPTYVNNYHTALAAAKKIGTKMKIVPVKKFSDVITYLKNHPN